MGSLDRRARSRRPSGCCTTKSLKPSKISTSTRPSAKSSAPKRWRNRRRPGVPDIEIDLVRTYLTSIAKRKLLTAREEQEIGRRIEVARGELLAAIGDDSQRAADARRARGSRQARRRAGGGADPAARWRRARAREGRARPQGVRPHSPAAAAHQRLAASLRRPSTTTATRADASHRDRRWLRADRIDCFATCPSGRR